MAWLLALALLAGADTEARLVNGVLRWPDGREVALFGVNYYTPHVYDYRHLVELGQDHRRVIDQDLAHLSRLGLDLLRLHVFDRELSDANGNLVANEHLALLDYLLARARQRGFHIVLTPIAWWPTTNDIGGFSSRYTMAEMCGDEAARQAQRRYLAQFVEHVNPLTGVAYGRDPSILLFELINEPIPAPGTGDEAVTEYIRALAAAIRETGCTKPIAFNAWGNRHRAVAAAGIEAVTFGWYPTGLASGATITANALGLVNDFPAMRDPLLDGLVKGVYEFDGADVQEPYLYPAMARAFRSGGAQFATQFQYDPWPLAASNAGWQTHFLSLPHAPGKALSFLIAGEAFRRLPRLATYGSTPEADRFGPFRVSYDEKLSELVTETEFLHSNTTTTRPPTPDRLERLAGVGSNLLVDYAGTGAWFLDRRQSGLWQLEVFPDVVLVADPYGPVSLAREVSRVVWAERPMRLALPDLGDGFSLEPINTGNSHRPTVDGNSFTVRPGVYRLVRRGLRAEPVAPVDWFAPPPVADRPDVIWHRAEDALVAGAPATVRANVTADGAPVTLCWRDDAVWRREPMHRTAPYLYVGTLPAKALRAGGVTDYVLALETDGAVTCFPYARLGWPEDRPLAPPQRVFAAGELGAAPAPTGSRLLDGPNRCELRDGVLALEVGGFAPDGVAAVRAPMTPPAQPIRDGVLRARARSLHPGTFAVEVGLVQRDGRAFGYDLPVSTSWSTIEVPLALLRPLWSTPSGARLDPAELSELSLVYGAWLYGANSPQPHGFELDWIELVEQPAAYRVPVEPLGPPVPLLRAAAVARTKPQGQEGGWVREVEGPEGRTALEFRHRGFGPPPSASGISGSVATEPEARRATMARCTAVRLLVRGLTRATNRVELILFERDGTPWGTTAVPVTADWREVVVPLADFELFRHYGPPADRGGDGDAPRPGDLVRWQLTIGAWLNPEQAAEAQVLQVGAMELVER